MTDDQRRTLSLDPEGFNDLCVCGSGLMIVNKHDQYIGASLRKYGEYSFGEVELFRQVVPPGSIVVEAGANIGAHTLELSRLAGARGAVFAFEPQRLVFQALCGNLALNQCVNVHALQRALGDEDGVVDIPLLNPWVAANFGGVSAGAGAGGPCEQVPLTRLDSLGLPGCRFLKVDVEGMEARVIEGARETINRHRPILYVENDRQESSPELLSLILGLGYDVYWHFPPLFNPGNFAGDSEDLFPGVVSANILCFPAEAHVTVEGLIKIKSPGEPFPLGAPKAG